MSVAVVIPWRGGCPHRKAALQQVIAWWGTHHPAWPIVLGTDDPQQLGGPWRKGLAVWNALASVTTTTVVISDADVILPDIHLAVAAVEQGAAWAAPFRTVYRLTAATTIQAYETGTLPPGPFVREPGRILEDLYQGQPGGGIVVLPTDTYRNVPLDPRFAGWGQEDLSWARALYLLAGGPWRSTSALYHLWHPPAPRMSHGIGNQAGLDLFARYRRSVHPTLMRPLVNEALDALQHPEKQP